MSKDNLKKGCEIRVILINMRNYIDIHTHTISSGHAYSTLEENIQAAKRVGLKVLGYSEHGPKMPGGPHVFHIANLKVIPRKRDELIILRGCEANIIDYTGKVDIPKKISRGLDYMIASLHDVCIENGGVSNNTEALLGAMDNEDVMVIGHPGNPAFPIDYEAVVLKAKEKEVLIEINNSSFHGSRKGSHDNCRYIAELCSKHEVNVIIGSDSHISSDIGGFDYALDMLKSIKFNEKLIMNEQPGLFLDYLKRKGKLSDI